MEEIRNKKRRLTRFYNTTKARWLLDEALKQQTSKYELGWRVSSESHAENEGMLLNSLIVAKF